MSRSFRPRAVVFDFDGTLIDSLSMVLRAIAHGLEPFGSQPEREIFARLGGPPERFLATMVDDPRHVPAALRRMMEFHRANAHLVRPFAGANQLLRQLQDRAQLGIWTGRDRKSTDELLAAHQLGDLFATVLCGDDLPTHKPDPAGLREIMRRLDVGPDETLFVGDADVDVLGGTAAGVATLLIRNGRTVDATVAARAWLTVETPAEALEVVRRSLD